jgi:hypothetical protein
VGDVFVMAPPDGRFLYGRVIATNAKPLAGFDAILVYIYSTRTTDRQPVPELLRGRLLVPPMMTNKRPWTMGYFEFVEHRPLSPLDRLPQHCFKDRKWYLDEFGNRLPRPVEPVGEFGLHSFRTIDDEISGALGIPLSPEGS